MILTPSQLSRRADFYFQLASLLTAGVPIIQALEMVRGTVGRSTGTALGRVLNQLNMGSTFTESLAQTGNWLPAFDLAVIGAGEQSGRLDLTLKSLGTFYAERAVLMRRIISDMAYPIFILHMAVLIFPTGALAKMVWSGGGEAYLLQKLSMLLPLYALVFLAIVALQGNRTKGWRVILERILNAIPAIGSARKSLALARLSTALEALLSAGVPVIQAWEIAGNACGSGAINRAVAWAKPRMETGMTPSEALRLLPVFPEVFRNLYASGELSGQLDATLTRLHNHYQEIATHKFRTSASGCHALFSCSSRSQSAIRSSRFIPITFRRLVT